MAQWLLAWSNGYGLTKPSEQVDQFSLNDSAIEFWIFLDL
jgi:hypothetical protein